MNILIINGNYCGGGSARVALDLYSLLKKEKMNVYYMVGWNKKKIDGITVLCHTLPRKIMHYYRKKQNKGICYNNEYAKKQIIKFIKENKIDIVHIHNIANAYFGIKDIADIARECKVVWTLHELWTITGGCYHPLDCNNWIEKECFECERMEGCLAVSNNLIHSIWIKKKESFAEKGIQFVVPSDWMYKQISKSFLQNEKIKVIYNGVDLDAYKVLDHNLAKKKYGISSTIKTLLFVAANINESGKGMDILEQALLLIEEKAEYQIVIVGKGEISEDLNKNFNVLQIGYINDKEKMNEILSLADVMVVPSKAESFSLVAAEAFAAGTPVIAFKAGGIEDVIDENTGWIVKERDAKSLNEIIEQAFSDSRKLLDMRMYCRERIEHYFTIDKMINEYKKLYESMVNDEC